MTATTSPRRLPLPETAFGHGGSLSLVGLLICRTARVDCWRYACPFCPGDDPFHDVPADWRGRVFPSFIPACCSSRTVTLREPVDFDHDGEPVIQTPRRFWTAGSGVLWPHWLIPDALALRTSRTNASR